MYWREQCERMTAELEEWQPIETAPRDGTTFLAALSNGWCVLLAENPGLKKFSWYISSGPTAVPIVRTHDSSTLEGCILATHWQPTPKPPKMENDR